MNYSVLKQTIATLETEIREASAKLNSYPRSATGMTLDSAKTPEWHDDRRKFANLHVAIRRLNGIKLKNFAAEAKAERVAARSKRKSA